MELPPCLAIAHIHDIFPFGSAIEKAPLSAEPVSAANLNNVLEWLHLQLQARCVDEGVPPGIDKVYVGKLHS